jgi:hypothetical protein
MTRRIGWSAWTLVMGTQESPERTASPTVSLTSLRAATSELPQVGVPEFEDAPAEGVPPAVVGRGEPLCLERPQQPEGGGDAQADACGELGQRLGRFGRGKRREHTDRSLDRTHAVHVVFHQVKATFIPSLPRISRTARGVNNVLVVGGVDFNPRLGAGAVG